MQNIVFEIKGFFEKLFSFVGKRRSESGRVRVVGSGLGKGKGFVRGEERGS